MENGADHSEVDDVYEDVFSTPVSAHAFAQQQRLQALAFGFGGLEQDEKVLETPSGGENGIWEKFEEAVEDQPDEDRIPGQLKTDAAADVGKEEPGGLAVVKEIESSELGIRGDEEDGTGIGEMGESVIVCENSGNGDSGGVATERGMDDDDDDKCGVSGIGERDGNAVPGGLIDHKEEEKDESSDGVILCETSANRHSDQVCFDNTPLVSLEKGKEGDYDEVGANVMPAGVPETSQNGELGDTGMVEAVSVVLDKSENGDFDSMRGEKVTNDNVDQGGSLKTEDASVDSPVNKEKIVLLDESLETADASAALGSSMGEEKIPLGHGTQKTEDGPSGSSMGEAISVSLDKSENGDVDIVHGEKVTHDNVDQDGSLKKDDASVDFPGNEEKIVPQDESLETADASAALGSSMSEEKTPLSHGTQKTEDGALGSIGDAVSVALENSGSGDVDIVHGEKVTNDNVVQDGSLKKEDASVDSPGNEEKIVPQDESLETADAFASLVSPMGEEKIPLGHETQKTEDGAVDNEGKIPCKDVSQETKDTSSVSDSPNLYQINFDDSSLQLADASTSGGSTGEEKIPCQYESQCREAVVADVTNSDNDAMAKTENRPPEVSLETGLRLEAQTCNSETLLSNNVHKAVSCSSEVVSRSNELQSIEAQQEDKEEKSNLPKESVVGESLERESVSVEEYGDSSSAEEDDSDLIVQPAQALRSSAVNHVEAPPPPCPAGLGSSRPLLEPAPRAPLQPRVNGNTSRYQSRLVEDLANGEAEEYDETREKLQMIRVKFLRLAHRLGQTPHNVVVAQVLYRLGLAEQLRGSRNTSRAGAFSFDRASAMAEQLEAAGQEALDFSCTIMVLGKTGVGKSATINSIFDEVKFSTDAFTVGTTKVQDIVGMVQGIKVRVIDTPGLHPSCMDQRRNEKILHSVKRFIKKTPPDIVLYIDRMDMQSRDFGDVLLLRTITDIFGPSIWFNAIVVLTHAASAPPDGPNGSPLSYEMFVTQRSHVVQQAIRQAAGDVRLMNPVSLVENHSACRTNRAGQRVLPNGQVWKPQLLLLSFASKILAEANTLLKLQDGPPGKPFTARARSPPLPFLLSSLLQSRPQLKLPEEQFGDEDAMDEDLDDTSDSDDVSEYDELPPFKRLTKAQLSELSKTQKKAYYDELEYREKLFMKKQLKEQKMRQKLLKKMAAAGAPKDMPNDYNENPEEERGEPASVPVPVPDMPLPASFDSDNPAHRYRYLDNSSQWLIRPVLDSHGWDHDVGYEGLNVERLFVVKDNIPVSFSGQVTKDKKECNFQMELASSIKHGEGKATSLGFDAQTVGKDTAYTLRAESRLMNFAHNKMAAGLSCTMLGDAMTAGLKLEDKMMLHKRLRLVMSGGAMTSRSDVAYGGSLEATLRGKDYPIGQILSSLGVSIMDWHGDLAIGCNVQSQFPVGRNNNMIVRANLNNRGSGQISLRLSTSEQLMIASIAVIPVFRNIIKNRLFTSS
ncbi:hypothetical protein ACLOJK_000758 [Asimina triloba]